MWLNRGRFRDNGNCGYLLRPPFHQPGFENKLEKRRRAAEESAEFSLLSQREVLKLAKEEAKRERKQAKLDAIAAKKQAKEDKRAAKEARNRRSEMPGRPLSESGKPRRKQQLRHAPRRML